MGILIAEHVSGSASGNSRLEDKYNRVKGPGFSITWDLPASARFIGICRNTLKTYLVECEVCQEDIDNVQIILGEACANVVRHAYKNHDEQYRVVVQHGLNKLALDIIDNGAGFDMLSPKDRCETDEGCGVGLALIRSLAFKADICSSPGCGAAVHVEYNLHPRRRGLGGRSLVPPTPS